MDPCWDTQKFVRYGMTGSTTQPLATVGWSDTQQSQWFFEKKLCGSFRFPINQSIYIMLLYPFSPKKMIIKKTRNSMVKSCEKSWNLPVEFVVWKSEAIFHVTKSGWWFGTMEFYDFPFSWEWNNHPIWRTHIFQRGRSTTNQKMTSLE